MNTNDSKLEAKVALDTTIKTWGGRLVLLGLIIEAVYAFLYREPGASFFKAWGSVIADGAVFTGVWMEIHFNGRASKSESELKRRSEERVSLANERAAKAEKAAEEARERTAAIERLTARRTLEPERRMVLISELTDLLPSKLHAWNTRWATRRLGS